MNIYGLTTRLLEIGQELEDNGGELTPELEQALEETTGSLAEKADGYRGLLAMLDDRADNIDRRIKELQAMKKTTDNARKRIKEYVISAMIAAGMTRIEGKTSLLYLRKTTSLNMDEELATARHADLIRETAARLPSWMTLEVKISKTEVKNLYKGSDLLPEGFEWAENYSLQVK